MNSIKKVEPKVQVSTKEVELFHVRLKGLMKDESMRSFGRKVGISDTTIKKYLSGETEPSLSRLVALAEQCGVNLEWLATGQEPKYPGEQIKTQHSTETNYAIVDVAEFNEEYALIPGYHISVSTGHGALNGDAKVKRQLAFRSKWLRYRKLNPKDLAVVFAKGDSMEPTINSGNSILVDLSDKQLHDGSIYVLRVGDNLFAKRLQQRFDGSVELLSDNKEYPAQIVKTDEIDQLSIIGKVVWIGKDLY